MEIFYSWKDFDVGHKFSREMILWVSQNLKRESTSYEMRYEWISSSRNTVYGRRGNRGRRIKHGIRIHDKADAMAFKLRWS